MWSSPTVFLHMPTVSVAHANKRPRERATSRTLFAPVCTVCCSFLNVCGWTYSVLTGRFGATILKWMPLLLILHSATTEVMSQSAEGTGLGIARLRGRISVQTAPSPSISPSHPLPSVPFHSFLSPPPLGCVCHKRAHTKPQQWHQFLSYNVWKE